MRKSVVVLLVVFLAWPLASEVLAGTYVGASFVETDSEFGTAFDDFEADDSSYKIFAGFTIIKFLGIEASYRDLGTHEDTVAANAIDVEITAYDLAARGILPVGKRVSLFAKAGYAHISTDGDLDLGGVVEAFDDDSWELMYGVGVEVKLLKFFGLRAEWETYDVDDDLNSLSAGALFRF